MKKFFREWYAALFSSKGKKNPVYLYAFIFLLLTMIAYVMRLFGVDHIDNALVIGVLGFVVVWIGLYNVHKNKNGGNPGNEE